MGHGLMFPLIVLGFRHGSSGNRAGNLALVKLIGTRRGSSKGLIAVNGCYTNLTGQRSYGTDIT